MENKRKTENQPFCQQEEKVLQLFRCRYERKELDRFRNLHLTLTEIYSDFNGRDIKCYVETIANYSGLSKAWIPKGLKIFEELKLIQLVEERSKGKFKGKRLIFTPENIEKEEKNDDKKNVTEKASTSFLKTSEDNLY